MESARAKIKRAGLKWLAQRAFPKLCGRRIFLLVFSIPPRTLRHNFPRMAKATSTLSWCIIHLGKDHNWWVDETSDPVRWDVDGLSIIDPRQLDHLIELVDPLRDYGFDQEIFEAAFYTFRIEKDLGQGRVRLRRVKDSIIDSDEKLFALPDSLDEENGPYADLLDHLTRCRVKLLNDLFDFEAKLTVDELEDELRENQNSDFIEGKAVHSFNELCAILDFVPAGYETDEEHPRKAAEEEEDDLHELDEEEEEQLKNDSSLKWEDEDDGDDEPEGKEDGDDEEDDDDGDDDADEDEEDEGRPRRRSRGGK